MSEVVSLVANKTDAQTAAEFRAEVKVHADRAAEVMERERVAGFSMGFNIGADNYGRQVVKDIIVVKPL